MQKIKSQFLKEQMLHYLRFFTKDHCLMVLYLFCLLFSPPVIPKINFIIPLAILSLAILAWAFRKNLLKLKALFTKTAMHFFIKGFVVYMGYVLVVILFNVLISRSIDLSQTFFVLYRCLLICPILLICIFYVTVWARSRNYTLKEFMLCLLIAASLQGILSLASLLFPEVKEILVKIMLFGTEDPLLANQWHLERRFFGFANNMYDGYGFGTGIFLALCFFCAAQWSKKFLIFAPLLFFPSFLNSRTGLVIFAIGVVISLPLFFDKRNKKSLLNLLLAVGVLLLAIVVIFLLIYCFSRPTFQWIMNILNLNKVDASLVKLFGDEFWNFPEGLQLIFGSGHTLYGADGFAHSDVGFVNDLWFTGILGTGFFYGVLVLLFRRVFKNVHDRPFKALVVYLGISMIAYNVKSMALTCNVGLVTVFLILFVLDIGYAKEEKLVN